jgi:hypothetical protein
MSTTEKDHLMFTPPVPSSTPDAPSSESGVDNAETSPALVHTSRKAIAITVVVLLALVLLGFVLLGFVLHTGVRGATPAALSTATDTTSGIRYPFLDALAAVQDDRNVVLADADEVNSSSDYREPPTLTRANLRADCQQFGNDIGTARRAIPRGFPADYQTDMSTGLALFCEAASECLIYTRSAQDWSLGAVVAVGEIVRGNQEIGNANAVLQAAPGTTTAPAPPGVCADCNDPGAPANEWQNSYPTPTTAVAPPATADNGRDTCSYYIAHHIPDPCYQP